METVANAFLMHEETKDDFLLEVLNILPIGIVFLSNYAEVIKCNHAFQGMFSSDNLHYLQVLRKYSGKVIDPDFKSLLQRIKIKNMVSTDARIICPVGKKKFVRVFGKEIFHAEEPIYVLTLSDIS